MDQELEQIIDGILRAPEVTICYQCRFFRNLEPGTPRQDAWYNHICLASPLPKVIDPVTGQLTPAAVNDLGRRYIGGPEYSYCRDINDGKCPKYQAK